jgi:hypothetical protein
VWTVLDRCAFRHPNTFGEHNFLLRCEAHTMAEEASVGNSFAERMLQHPLFRSFLWFAIFRAFYGAGILVVTWFLASEAEAPLWVSVLFLLCSMVFSRLLFRGIKRLSSKQADASD